MGAGSFGLCRAGLVVAAGVVASACGTTIGTGAPPEASTTVRPTTTETTIPPSTIDFDRPVTQGIDTVPTDATVTELVEVVADMRGQTTDVSAQMARLIPDFVDIQSPDRAQILDVDVNVGEGSDGLFELRTAISYRTPLTPEEASAFVDRQLRGISWNRSKSDQEISGDVMTDIVIYRVPGLPGSEEELMVSVSDGPDVTTITLEHFTASAENEEVSDLLSAWHAGLPLPAGAVVMAVSVTAAADQGTLMVAYEVPGESTDEARDELIAGLVGGDYTSASSGDRAVDASAGTEDGDGTDDDADRTDEDGTEDESGNGTGAGEIDGDRLAVLDPDGELILIDFATSPTPDSIGINAVHEFPVTPVDP